MADEVKQTVLFADLFKKLESYEFKDPHGNEFHNCQDWSNLQTNIYWLMSVLQHGYAASPSQMLIQVEQFTKDIVGVPIPEKPTLLNFERGEFRLGHLKEELLEFEEAMMKEDLDNAVDGLLDLIYIALGCLLEMGIVPGPAFTEVHTANMLKKRGELAKRPGSAGYDAVKPEGWQPPDINRYLSITKDDVEFLEMLKEDAFMYSGEDVDDIKAILPKPKILVLGHARHGKDTVCEMLAKMYGLKFTSSSWFCAEKVIMPLVKYPSVQECFDDRHNHRQLWYNSIASYNFPDRSRLATEILEENDIYCGMRHAGEFHACNNKDLFDLVIWVDRSEHVDPEPATSCSVEPWMADFVLDNNGSEPDGLDQLRANLVSLIETQLPMLQRVD